MEDVVSEERVKEIVKNSVDEHGIHTREEKVEDVARDCLVKIVKEDEKLELIDKEEFDFKYSITDKEFQERKEYYKEAVQEEYQRIVFSELMGVR